MGRRSAGPGRGARSGADASGQLGSARLAAVVRSHQHGEVTQRAVAVEAPVSIEFNGLAYAVMLATPADLEDFACGFALAEGVVGRLDEVEAVDVYASELGWILRIDIAPARIAPIRERVRQRVSDGGCGLCGVANLEGAMRLPPSVRREAVVTPAAVFRAIAGLSARQPLNAATGAVHAAALCDAGGEIVSVREDVGRHNAFDKLIGALARSGQDPASGFALLSSRCSYELVDKALTAGFSALATLSAPTTLAVSRARACGLTLIGLARADNMLVLNDPAGRFSASA